MKVGISHQRLTHVRISRPDARFERENTKKWDVFTLAGRWRPGGPNQCVCSILNLQAAKPDLKSSSDDGPRRTTSTLVDVTRRPMHCRIGSTRGYAASAGYVAAIHC